MKRRYFAVVNPKSCSGKTESVWKNLEDRLVSYFKDFDYSFTSCPRHAEDIAREAVFSGFNVIISVGGDGTHNEVLNGLMKASETSNSEFCLAIFPSGTGDDLTKTLSIPKDLNRWVRLLRSETYEYLDVGAVEFPKTGERRYFLNIASFGIAGIVDREVKKITKRFGKGLAFFLATVKTILNYKNQEVGFILDDKVNLNSKIVNVAVCNCQYFGGGMWVAPMADPKDGLLDVIVIGDFPKYEILAKILKIYRGKHIDVSGVYHYRCKKLIAKSPKEVFVDTDGEHVGTLPAIFRIIPKAIKVIK